MNFIKFKSNLYSKYNKLSSFSDQLFVNIDTSHTKMNSTKQSSARKAKPSAKKDGAKKAGITGQARAGLLLAPARVLRLMRRDRLTARMGRSSSVVMAAMMEYITSEIIEISGEQAKKAGRHRIKPRDIQLAISGDDELSKLCRNITISEGGRPPHINPALLPKKGKAQEIEATQQM